jgi:hypothetical protein
MLGDVKDMCRLDNEQTTSNERAPISGEASACPKASAARAAVQIQHPQRCLGGV